MKKSLRILKLCCFAWVMIALTAFLPVAVVDTQAAVSSQSQKEKKQTSEMPRRIKKIGGKFYCYIKGKKYKGGWKTLRDNDYYFSTRDGHALTGWQKIGKNTYYFSKKNAALQKNKWIGKYYVKSDGVRIEVPSAQRYVKLNKEAKTLYIDEVYSLTAIYNNSYISSKDIKWKSSNPSVATVNNKGKITAKKAGTCEISAGIEGDKKSEAQCKVTVKAKNKLRILMLGNSFTHRNQLPETLAELTHAEIVTNIVGGGRLAKYLDPSTPQGAKALQALENQRWDYVVLQERSYLPAKKPAKFLKSARRLCEKIHEIGATPVFYSTWAYKNNTKKLAATGLGYKEMYQLTREAYIQATKENQGIMADVGTIFYEKSKYYNLYNKDNYHPNEKGSQLAADAIAKTIMQNEEKY